MESEDPTRLHLDIKWHTMERGKFCREEREAPGNDGGDTARIPTKEHLCCAEGEGRRDYQRMHAQRRQQKAHAPDRTRRRRMYID